MSAPTYVEEEYESASFLTGRPKGRRGGRRRLPVWPFLLLALAVLGYGSVTAARTWYERQIDPPGEPGEEVAVRVPEGTTVSGVGEILAREGVLPGARGLRLYSRFNEVGDVQAGRYTLRRNSSVEEALAVLDAGPEQEFVSFTLPEGLVLSEMAAAVERQLPGRTAARFTEVVASGTIRSRFSPEGQANLEGLLLPNTYQLEAEADEEAIVRRLVEEMDALLAELGVEAAAAARGLTPYDLVTVASLVEREAKREEDRGPVAQVVYNRLREGIPLQIDASVLYGLGRQGGALLRSEIEESDSPYNTYRNRGLPPTPIAAPGEAALRAAVAPPEGDFYYYVTVNDCTAETVFATTLREHNRNVARRSRENPESC